MLANNGNTWQVPYERFDSVIDFLNDVYFSLSPNVPPYTYGETWILRDLKTRKLFNEIGQLWAEKHGMAQDSRNLKNVGIVPGMTLEVIYPSKDIMR